MAVKTKRNLRALKRLRAKFAKVPDEKVHMARYWTSCAPCGTAGCLLGWARQFELRGDKIIAKALKQIPAFGLTGLMADRLFAIDVMHFAGFSENPHAVTKAQVLHALDRLIAGKSIKSYPVKPA